MKFIRSLLLRRLRHAAPLAVLAAGAWIGQSWAAGGTLADAPLFTSSAEQIKPNIMFILDNSGSMDWNYTPVAAGNFGDKQYGKYAPQCNGLAFDPDQEYPIPVDHKGNAKPTPTFDVGNPANDTESQKDVKGTVTMPKVDDTITVELDSAGRTSYQEGIVVTVFKDKSTYFVGTVVSYSKPNVKIKVTGILPVNGNGSSMGSKTKLGKGEPKGVTYYAYEGKQPRLGYKYDGGVLDTGNAFYKECASEIGKGDGAKVFVAKTVTAVSPEAQKYANWSTYYRSRMSVMKAAISFAFKDLGDRYRVGYATINDYTDTDNFLDIKDFAYNNATDKGHKKDFYTKFWSAEPNGGTPLRGALSRAGQYFANKMPGQQSDPIEYSCQRNFTILSTDGYWNSKDGVESASYGPFKLDNKTKVGQQDGTLKRPMRDGASVTTDTEERWEQTIVKYINYETPTTTTTGKQTVTRKRVAQQRSRKTYSQGGSHSCGFLQSKWIETTENMNVLRERTDTTISQRQVTVSKKLEPVKITEVWNVVRTVKDVDGVPFPADEQRTLKSRTEVANGEATTDPGTPQSLPPDTQTTWKDLGTESLASSTAGKCYSWFSSPSNTGWDDIGSPVETVLGTSGPTDVNKVEGPGARALAAAPTSQEVVDGTKTVKETSTSTGGQENTLADVAAYYYQTDLRTDDLKNCTNPKGVNVCDNNVPGSSSTDAYRSYGDSASWQHMTTFTLGLGVNGVLDYDPAYLTASSRASATGRRRRKPAAASPGPATWTTSGMPP